ncbi:MAG: hypothetical protein K9F93_01425 [Candidatus Nanopelagicales bacterium]|nr:hypothetical protein [Candidatus Nanopelagicales bacterium]
MAIPIRVPHSAQSKPVAKANRKTQDPRLWLGILFMIAAMIVGQLVVSGASARVPAVVINANIAQGALIRDTDVSSVQVSVPSIENLISVPSEVIGKVASRDLFAGDLISAHSISTGFAADARNVSVPIRAGHLPQVNPGEKVDIWMTPSVDGVALPGPASLIIPSAVIAAAPEFIDAGMDTSVTVLISQDQVQVLVQAMRDGVIDLVAIPVTGNEL